MTALNLWLLQIYGSLTNILTAAYFIAIICFFLTADDMKNKTYNYCIVLMIVFGLIIMFVPKDFVMYELLK